jgi:hypothetical protein
MYKGNQKFDDKSQKVIVVPDIERKIISSEEISKNSFLFLACDGIWDVFSNEEMFKLISEELKNESIDINNITEKIIDMTIVGKISKDNCSVVLVLFEDGLVGRCANTENSFNILNETKIKDFIKNYESEDLFSELKGLDGFFKKYVGINDFNVNWLNVLKNNPNYDYWFSEKDEEKQKDKVIYESHKDLPHRFVDYFNRISRKLNELNLNLKDNILDFHKHTDYLKEEGIETFGDFKDSNLSSLYSKGIHSDLLKFLDFNVNSGFYENYTWNPHNPFIDIWFERNFGKEIWEKLKIKSGKEIDDMSVKEFNDIFDSKELSLLIYNKIHE